MKASPEGSKKVAIAAFLDDGETEETLGVAEEELALLLANLGVRVAGTVVQKKRTPDPAYYLGKGKAEEMALFGRESGAGLLVCDGVLSSGQRHNLSKASAMEVWDRPEVIMRIFEARAHSAEARLQIELARCRTEIPTLKGLGQQMSRTGGGIATRGPGETEFERHRRKLERRVRDIEKKLEAVRRRRKEQRNRRRRIGLPTVALVGYTNSGKSTLLRALSRDAHLLVADKLFSTLDTSVRKVRLPSGSEMLVADTVGFIRRLPPAFVAAFRATLEEVTEADLLLHVVDVGSSDLEAILDTVQETLGEIEAGEIDRILVLNKIDTVEPSAWALVRDRLCLEGEDVVAISAREGIGLEGLLEEIDRRLALPPKKTSDVVPGGNVGEGRGAEPPERWNP